MGALNTLSAIEALRQLAAGRIKSQALVADCLERIAAREHEVQAWQYLNSEATLRLAHAADATPSNRPLHGLPFAIKDIIDTYDMPTEYGSAIYAHYRPPWDASCVALARAAGAIPLGKTVATEFATRTPAKTRNPVNLAHTPGGSSSGSAAAVADYMVPVALGTQTAGSVIRPAAYCGVVGYKPSFGVVSRVGVKTLAHSLDTVGIFARTVPDAALFAAIVSGRKDLTMSHTDDTAPRVGLCRTHEWKYAQPEIQAALEAAGGKIAAAGATVKDINLPPTYANLVPAQIDIMLAEMTQSLAHERFIHSARLSDQLRANLEAAAEIAPERYHAAQALARHCRRTLTEAFSDCDVLIAPSAPSVAPQGLASTGDPVFCSMWTLLHTPCINIPVGRDAAGLPIGLQVIGNYESDVQTLAAAYWLHQRLN